MLHQHFNFRIDRDTQEKTEELVFVDHDSVDAMYQDVWLQIPRDWVNNCEKPMEGKIRRRRKVDNGKWEWYDHFTHNYIIKREGEP